MDDPKTPAPAPSSTEVSCPPSRGQETQALLERAIRGDPTCRTLLDALLDLPDRGGRIVELFGDVPGFAERAFVAQASGENVLLREALTRKMAGLRAELAGPEPTPIERLLAERAAYCWLVLWRYEEKLVNAKDLTWKQAEFHQRWIDGAHKRYLSSLRTLATVRKLAVPNIRVNVGPHRHEAESPPPCSCRDGSELPTFADRFSRIK